MFFIGVIVCPTYCSLCPCQSTVTSTRKLKWVEFWWSQRLTHLKFGRNMKQSWSCNLIFIVTVIASHSEHVMIMPAQCRWYILDTLYLIFLRSKSFSLPRSSIFNSDSTVSKLSCLTQQQLESLQRACNACTNVFSVVGKICGLMQAQCAVVNRSFIGYLFQQWREINVNSYLINEVVWELLNKLPLSTV